MRIHRITFLPVKNYIKTNCKRVINYLSEKPNFDEFCTKNKSTGLTTGEFIDLILKNI